MTFVCLSNKRITYFYLFITAQTPVQVIKKVDKYSGNFLKLQID